MFNNSSHIDASHGVFSEVHGDQYYKGPSVVQGNQTVSITVTGNQIVQESSDPIEILRKACAPSAAHDSVQRHLAPKCIKGTRIELRAHLSSWIDRPDEKPICWLNGRPGTGKSAVSQTMAEEYATQGRLAASFFFSRRDRERRTMQYVIPTLAMQLLSFFPSIRSTIVAALEKDYMIPMKVLREQMEKLLIHPLSTLTEKRRKPVLIVLDALDECDDDSLVSELITLVSLLPRKTSLPLRFLITSRSESWIQSRFHRPDVSSVTLPVDIHTFTAVADIRHFLRHALDDTYEQRIQVMKDHPRPWPSSNDLERIVDKSAGLFIFAHTVVKYIGDEMHHPAERLKAILEPKATASTGSAYFELDLLYRDAISAFSDPPVAQLILGIVYCMAIPLSVAGLHKLLQRPDVDARVVVPALGSVLLAEDGPVQFYHASFRDFLVDSRRSQNYAINADEYHMLMAQLCLEAMFNSLKRDMCGIRDPSRANSEVPELVKRREAFFDEALLYACRFWSRHLAQLLGDRVADAALLRSLHKFSTGVLLYWIEALSLLGELESAVVMLREGVCWLKTLSEIPANTLRLLEDAERLVVLHMDCISQCALHVYLTALSLVPRNNTIYKTFKHLSLGTFILQPVMPESWLSLRRSTDLRTHIHSVVFSPNGDWIATAGKEQGVQVWDTITGGNVASLGDCSSTSLLVSFSPSGAFLAAAFEGGTLVVWDPKVGREHLKDEHCHADRITCIEFSPNSVLLASGSRDHVILVWSTGTVQRLYRLATHVGPVTSLVFSIDSRRLFSGSQDKVVVTWNMSSGRMIREMRGHRGAVNCIALSNDGELLASGSDDETIRLWSTRSGRCTQTLSDRHSTGVQLLHFFNEDNHLAAVYNDVLASWSINPPQVCETVWSAADSLRMLLRRLPAPELRLLGWGAPEVLLRSIVSRRYKSSLLRLSASFATRSSSIVFTFLGLIFTGTLPNAEGSTPVVAPRSETITAISSDGAWAVSADVHGSLQIIDLNVPTWTWGEFEEEHNLYPVRLIEKIIPSLAGTRFIIRNLQDWYLVDGDYHILKRIDSGLFGSIRRNSDFQFKFSEDSSIFICIIPSHFTDKCKVRVFDAMTGEQRAQFLDLKRVHSFVSSVDGAWIACCHGYSEVEVFEVTGGTRKSMGVYDDALITVLVFSNDAELLIGGSKTGIVRAWDRASGECKAMFGGSTSMVTALAYGPMGAQVAVGREDGSLSVWSPSTSASHDILCFDQVMAKGVDFVQFSRDQTVLTSRSEDGSVFSWALAGAGMTRCARCSLQDSERTDDVAQMGSPPHLLSRVGSEDTVDSLFHTTYRVRKDGWLVDGEQRLIWIPAEMRPRGKDKLFAYENRFVVIIAPSMFLFFLKWDQ